MFHWIPALIFCRKNYGICGKRYLKINFRKDLCEENYEENLGGACDVVTEEISVSIHNWGKKKNPVENTWRTKFPNNIEVISLGFSGVAFYRTSGANFENIARDILNLVFQK